MADMNLVLRLQAEVAAAMREMRAVQKEVKGIADAGKQAGADLKPMDAALAALGEKGAAAARKASTGMEELQRDLDAARLAAEKTGNSLGDVPPIPPQVPDSVRQTGQAANVASGQIGNLTAQWNDVIMMIAAGQNPVQLALQQGMQITQIFGTRGAAGAMALLRGSVSALLNPFNLLTIAAIGFGAAAVQWLMGVVSSTDEAAEKVLSFEDQLKAVDSILTDIEAYDFDTNLDGMKVAAAAIRAEFDTILAVVERVQAAALQTELNKMREGTGLGEKVKEGLYESDVAGRLGKDAPTFDFLGLDSLYQAQFALQAIYEIQGETREEILKSVQATSEKLALMGLLTPQLEQQLAAMAQQFGLAEQIKQSAEGEAVARAEVSAQLANSYQLYAASRVESDAAVASTGEMLAALQAEAELQALINQYGADSAVVTAARAEAEREAYAAMVDGLDVSAAMKDELMSAWDAANGIANARIAAMLEGALGPAATLVAKLWEGAKAAAAMQAAKAWVASNQPGGTSDLARQYQQYGEGRMAAERAAQTTVQFSGAVPVIPTRSVGGGVGAGGGGGAGRPERDSFDDLQRRAKEAMTALDDALAAIQEKVRLGLMTTAEATDAIGTAKERAANQMAELIPKLTKVQEAAGPKGAAAIALWREQVKGLVDDMKIASADIEELSEDLSSGFESRFTKAMMGSKNAFADFGSFVLETMAKLASKRFTENIISPLFDSILGGFGGGGGGGGGGLLGGLFGSLFGGGGFKLFAKGGVPDAPLSAYSNMILDQPTLFPMAGGKTGLMAEAGTEAIMPVGDGGVLAVMGGIETRLPLTRGAGGRLGVQVPDWQSPAGTEPTPFALGGVPNAPLSAYSNMVLNQPTLFPMAGGKTGLMAEAGTEAIMPVANGGVLAMMGGVETRLPLTRGAGGRLGVQVPDWRSPADTAPIRFALGGVPGGESGSLAAGQVSVGAPGGITVQEGDLIVNVENRVAGAQIKTEQDRENGTRMLRVIVEQVDAALAEKQRRGDSAFGNALAANLGASRTGR